MEVFTVRNVNEAVATVIPWLLKNGILENSRNGRVLVAPGPVTTIYMKPQERVLFSPARNANPFFHLMESLWMLAGRNDLAFPQYFNKRFGEYSDDGKTVHGAYGWRWRKAIGVDQLSCIADELRLNPTSRRCVLQMWSACPTKNWNGDDYYGAYGCNDLELAINGGRDVPCNTHAYFDARGGVLNMTVCNRSNDAIWGAYGANAVHFSVLQEYMAAWIGIPMGVYRQVSNNFHAYLDIYDEAALAKIAEESEQHDYYKHNVSLKHNDVYYGTLINHEENVDMFNNDLQEFFREWDNGTLSAACFTTEFFKHVVGPMSRAWILRKTKQGNGMHYVTQILSSGDWRMACRQWIERMEAKKNA